HVVFSIVGADTFLRAVPDYGSTTSTAQLPSNAPLPPNLPRLPDRTFVAAYLDGFKKLFTLILFTKRHPTAI
ncbi:hypothetical protein, partial [Phyllobacterium sophorae]|uniref:hypothetical protein n=1 Tax=Phyllobacterium sophorae TaxID=1520277 RepID=UPI001AECC1AB